MKTALKVLFTTVMLVMAWVTVTASMDRGVMTALRELWPDPWFRATVADTYFAFLTISLWVWYKERGAAARVLWFLGIMVLGNFAIAAYLLVQLFKLKKEDPVTKILTR